MKYINEFRDKDLAKKIIATIFEEVDQQREYRFMEFCGGHTHVVHRYGLPALLPKNIELIHGPGCPVCVLPVPRLDQAINLAMQKDIIFCSYGDMLRVPGSDKMSLLKAKSQGADVRMVYSIDDSLELAKQNPDKQVVFFAIGFETTTPPTATAILKAKELGLKNFYAFCNHVLTPAALNAILSLENKSIGIPINGIIGPAHVSVVVGSDSYKIVAKQYKKPIVISGFEPLDVLYAILMLVRQVNRNSFDVENQYIRAVTQEGNLKSQEIVSRVLELNPEFEWRGLGMVPDSALRIKSEYREFDAEYHFECAVTTLHKEHKGCECGMILQGLKKPTECKLFGKVCTPENPVGACMVSSEGACAAYYVLEPSLS